MIAKTLSFGSPGQLTTRYEQLVYAGEDGVKRTFPIEDLGFVILESPQITITSALVQKLTAANVAVVVCDAQHLPSAQIIPYAAHTTAQETIAAQLAATPAVCGRIWRQIVQQKIRNQAFVLEALGRDGVKRLRTLADDVKNGDGENVEAQAARIYFQNLMPPEVSRLPEGPWPNNALNYGYALVRAAVARALVGSGLLCLRGVHHHNRYDALCLADDVMEPFRPFVDRCVFSGEKPFDTPLENLSREVRTELLKVLTCDVQCGAVTRPLMIAATFTSASLARYFRGADTPLVLPAFPA